MSPTRADFWRELIERGFTRDVLIRQARTPDSPGFEDQTEKSLSDHLLRQRQTAALGAWETHWGANYAIATPDIDHLMDVANGAVHNALYLARELGLSPLATQWLEGESDAAGWVHDDPEESDPVANAMGKAKPRAGGRQVRHTDAFELIVVRRMDIASAAAIMKMTPDVLASKEQNLARMTERSELLVCVSARDEMLAVELESTLGAERCENVGLWRDRITLGTKAADFGFNSRVFKNLGGFSSVSLQDRAEATVVGHGASQGQVATSLDSGTCDYERAIRTGAQLHRARMMAAQAKYALVLEYLRPFAKEVLGKEWPLLEEMAEEFGLADAASRRAAIDAMPLLDPIRLPPPLVVSGANPPDFSRSLTDGVGSLLWTPSSSSNGVTQ